MGILIVLPTSGTNANLTLILPTYFTKATFQAMYLRPDITPGAGYCAKTDFPTTDLFRATASGVIAPGILVDTVDASLVDQWSIDQDRQLINIIDGIQ